MNTLTYSGRLTIVNCWCGITYALPESLENEARANGKATYCPLGHSGVYHETTESKLAAERRARKDAEQRVAATRELLQAEERSHSATRGHLTRQKRRAAAGVCPCCKRTFKELARHIESKHPEYLKQAAV